MITTIGGDDFPLTQERPGDGAVDIEFVCRFLGEYFDVPCSYTLDGTNCDEVMTAGDDGVWCDAHCGSVADAECWKRFFGLWKGRDKRE